MKPVQQTKEAPAGDVFDTQKVRRYAQIMKEFGLCELSLQDGETHISLKSTAACAPVAPVQVAAPVVAAAPAVVSTPVSAPASAPVAAEEENPNVKTIDAPIVGTFYSKPNPNSPVYVSVGDSISEGQTVCIIEAMKVMNQLPSTLSGKILAILVKDGDAVEYGQPLFKVEVK